MNQILQYTEIRVKFGTEEVPRGEAIKPGEFFTMVDESGKVVGVQFICPCGCGKHLYTPCRDADKGEVKSEDYWLYSKGPNGPTVDPSIRWLCGCKGHFNITDGKAIIHEDSGK